MGRVLHIYRQRGHGFIVFYLRRCCRSMGLVVVEDRRLPYRYARLMRWDRFSATWLLAWPCFWSIGLATPAGSLPDPYIMTLFATGSIIMRSAGCTVNDMWDVDLDKLVLRTKDRPLAASEISKTNALGNTLTQDSMRHLWSLTTTGHPPNHGSVDVCCRDSKILGASSVGLVVTYPLMKRITNWLYLGATMNWGTLLGWSAVRGSCDWSVCLPLYASGVLWTLMYDTIYACQDKEDDQVVGIKSTALHFGSHIKLWLSGFATGQLACLGTVGWAAGCGIPYYAAVMATGCHLIWQIASVDIDAPKDCMSKFASNKYLGGILFSGIILDKLI